MRRLIILVIAALIGWAAGVYAGGYSTAQIGPQETDTPLVPDAVYVDPVTKEPFFFSPSLNLYLGYARLPWTYGKNAATVSLGLGIYGSALTGDTTRTSPVGFADPESVIVTGFVQWCKRNQQPAANCSTEVWVCPPDSSAPVRGIIRSWAVDARVDSACGLAIFAGPGDRVVPWYKVKAVAAVNPNYPEGYLVARHFRRP